MRRLASDPPFEVVRTKRSTSGATTRASCPGRPLKTATRPDERLRFVATNKHWTLAPCLENLPRTLQSDEPAERFGSLPSPVKLNRLKTCFEMSEWWFPEPTWTTKTVPRSRSANTLTFLQLNRFQRELSRNFCRTAAAASLSCCSLPGGGFHSDAYRANSESIDAEAFFDLFVWPDRGNAQVLRDGDAAILDGPGDGVDLEHLAPIGERRVARIPLTYHDREPYRGAVQIERFVTKVATPNAVWVRDRIAFPH